MAAPFLWLGCSHSRLLLVLGQPVRLPLIRWLVERRDAGSPMALKLLGSPSPVPCWAYDQQRAATQAVHWLLSLCLLLLSPSWESVTGDVPSHHDHKLRPLEAWNSMQWHPRHQDNAAFDLGCFTITTDKQTKQSLWKAIFFFRYTKEASCDYKLRNTGQNPLHCLRKFREQLKTHINSNIICGSRRHPDIFCFLGHVLPGSLTATL